ncbi:MAG: two-component system response regulator OmpR [Proteobacteria bacterium]|nr:two-component system response regulator OmpR [Pseudomonadota bacterium]MCL2307315.1 two-component system response regulator OmpR [Pseudomonadota bacterium]
MNTPDRHYRILVIDDDPRLRDLLQRYLTENGLETITLPDSTQLEKTLQRFPPHLIVLDLMLPGEDGLSICRKLRGAHNVESIPIIMLTARREEVDRIIGLEMGADDYLGKPFNPRELLARIHAVLRRAPKHELAGAPTEEGTIPFGPYTLDLAARTLCKDGEIIHLSTAEFSLLKIMGQNPRQPFTRERLSLLARGKDHETFDRAIDMQISRLRKLVETDPINPRYIQTVRGFGYIYVPEDSKAGKAAEEQKESSVA